MSAARHTPGPWRVHTGSANAFRCATDRIIVNALGDSVAYLPFTDEPAAALIAAAPDLLAACIQAESVLRVFRECSVLKAGAPDTEAKLRAAILKAEGGAK